MSERIPFVQIDTSGAPTLDGVADEETLAGTEAGLLILGKDGSSKAQILKTGTDGAVAVTDNDGALTVDDGGGSLTVDGTVSIANFPATQPVSGSVSVSNFPATQPVSAASLPLPAGAATETTLAALNTKTPALGQATMASSQPVVIASDQSAIPVSGTLEVTGGASETTLVAINDKIPELGQTTMAASQPVVIASDQTAIPISDGAGSITVDGTVSVTGTANVAVTSSALPTGAASETTLAALSAKINAQGQKTMAGSTPVVLASDQSAIPVIGNIVVTDGAQETTLAAINTKTPSLVSGRVPVDGSAVTQPVSAASLPLPTGAATSALQTTGNTSLSSIDTKLPAKGQATMTNSLPVVLASNQTPIPISDNAGSITVDGSVSLTGTPNVSVTSSALPTGAATEATVSALNAKFNSQGQKTMAASTPVVLASDQSAIPVIGNIVVTDGAQETTLSAINTKTPSLVSGRVPVDGSAVTQPVSAASLPLPSGAATSALQTTGNTSLSNIDTKFPAKGQNTMVNSLPVVIASNQSAIPVSLSGAATETTLSSINTKTPTLVSGRVPVDGSAVTQPVEFASPGSATLTNVSTSTTSVQLLAASSRKGACIANDSSAILYIKFGSTATTTSYTVALAPAVAGIPSYYEVHKDYSGRIDGVLSTGTGVARITVLT